MHHARRFHHPHAQTLGHAELSTQLPGYQQKYEQRQCRFVLHSPSIYT